MRRLFHLLKAVLPPQVSHRLRVAKARVVDGELKKLRVLASELASPDVVALDVGANDGIYASVLAHYFPLVVCVEPNPACARLLRLVLPSNCVVVEAAVSESFGEGMLNVPHRHGRPASQLGSISLTNTAVSSAPDSTRFAVRTEPIDAIVADHVPPGFRTALLKIDVEGHESAALRSATQLLLRDRPLIVAELEERHGTPVREIIEFLNGLGYAARPNDTSKPQVNFVFCATPRDSSDEDPSAAEVPRQAAGSRGASAR